MKTILERSTILSHYAAANLAFFGAMQGGINGVLEMIQAITAQCKQTEDLESWLLDSVAGSIISAKRTPNKKDADLRSELFSITRRGGAKKWNTARAGVEFLRYYFPDTNNPANIWGLYPLLYENLVKNPSFETATDWKLTLAAIITNTSGITTFRGTTIAALAPKGSLAQTIKIGQTGHYALRFAHYGGNLRVSLYDENSLYWKAQRSEKNGLPAGGWQNAAHYHDIDKCNDWSVHTLFFRVDSTDDSRRSVTVHIEVPTGKGIERRNLYPQLQIGSTTAYQAAYRGSAYRDGPTPATTGSLPSVAALVDDVHLGRYRSPGLQYMVRVPQNGIGKPGQVRNLYDGAASRSGDASAAYRDQTFRPGYSVRAYSEATKRDWLKIISAAGVPADIDIFGGLS